MPNADRNTPHGCSDTGCNWDTPAQVSAAIFEWIETWYNPRRRHTSIAHRSPAEFEHLHRTAATAA
ncbi:IS3 family transposase [Pseudonocardia sp. KRD291]|uniref:IS3 family transposase n=1 Tax=Pseudonocardia sp. KRD291 TaxID=2792007 RepID=UPI001C4A5BEA|nr:IS3 family transposase [Pseudonocardia sp. KRD291]